MATIKRTNTGEKKALISEAKFRRNISKEENVVFGISSGIFGLNKFFWILIGAYGGALGLLILLLGIGKQIHKPNRSNQNNSPVTTIVNNNIIITPQNEIPSASTG